MPGLRERNKAGRQRRILDAAQKLFREHGFDAATVEGIADVAEVAPATVYNYYGTKGDLLLALVAQGDQEVIEGCRRLILMPPSDPVDAVCRLLCQFTTSSLERVDRSTWRQVLANSILQTGSDVGSRLVMLNRRFSDEVSRLLESLMTAGRLPDGCDCRSAGEVLFNTHHALFVELISDELSPLSEYEDRLRTHVTVVLNGLRGHGLAL